MRSSRVVLLLLCLLACLLLGAGPASAARSGVDQSFGQDGVVQVEPLQSPEYAQVFVVALAAAPGGASYALESGVPECLRSPCGVDLFLVRYGADGSLDPAFNGRSGVLVAQNVDSSSATLIADGRGRPVVVLPSAKGYIVNRFDLVGSPDPGFGGDGKAWVGCGCSAGRSELVLDSRGRILIESVNGSFEGPSTVFLARLRPDGTLDQSFGRQGSEKVSFELSRPAGFAARPSGAVYLFGNGCCDKESSFYVIRISRRGRLDTHFNTRSRRSLERLRKELQRRGASFSDETLVLRPHGRMDLFASSYGEDSFVLRMLESGDVDRSFGDRGSRRLALPVTSAALDDRGGTFAIGSGGSRLGLRITHLLASGRQDPSFAGGGSLPLPGPGEEGDAVVAQRGRRAMVLDLGEHVCRQYCPQTPRLLRFVAGGGGGTRR